MTKLALMKGKYRGELMESISIPVVATGYQKRKKQNPCGSILGKQGIYILNLTNKPSVYKKTTGDRIKNDLWSFLLCLYIKN